MFVIPDEKKRDIADALESGFTCYYHLATGEIEKVRDCNHKDYVIDGFWRDMQRKIEANTDEYLEFSRMDTQHSFRVMEDFARTVEDYDLQWDLLDALQERKPFAAFKRCIDRAGEYREKWFAFKRKRYANRVEKTIRLYRQYWDNGEEAT